MHRWHSRKSTSFVSLLIALTLVCLPLLVTPRPAHASAIIVNSLEDNGPGDCATICTLRDAIAVANLGDTISFSVTGIITLTQGMLTMGTDLTISGPGTNLLTIDGSNTARV